jgi:hypothetical protein
MARMEPDEISYRGYRLTVIEHTPTWQVNIHSDSFQLPEVLWADRIVSRLSKDDAVAEAKRLVDEHLTALNPQLPPG